MDLNYLFSRHQTSLMQAAAAGSSEARIAHKGRAAIYAEQIRDLQADTQVARPFVAAF